MTSIRQSSEIGEMKYIAFLDAIFISGCVIFWQLTAHYGLGIEPGRKTEPKNHGHFHRFELHWNAGRFSRSTLG